jgi:hypothetical protein
VKGQEQVSSNVTNVYQQLKLSIDHLSFSFTLVS